MDELDGRLLDPVPAAAADRGAGGVAPARRRPRDGAGAARQAGRDRGRHRLGPEPLARGARLPGDGVPDPGDPAGRGPRRRRQPPRRDPRGARGVHHHRRRRHVGAGRRPLQRRPPAGDRPGARRPRDRAVVDRDRAGRPDPVPGAAAGAGRGGSPRPSGSSCPPVAGSGRRRVPRLRLLAGKIMQLDVAWATSRSARVEDLRLARAPYAARAGRPCPSHAAGRSRRSPAAGTSRSGRARCRAPPAPASSAPSRRRRCRAAWRSRRRGQRRAGCSGGARGQLDRDRARARRRSRPCRASPRSAAAAARPSKIAGAAPCRRGWRGRAGSASWTEHRASLLSLSTRPSM